MSATATPTERIDWKEVSDKLQNLLRLRTLPVGMKLFETVETMEAIPKIRRPKKHHTTCHCHPGAAGGLDCRRDD